MVALALMVSCMPSAYTISASEAFGDGTEDIFTDGEITSEPAAEESTPDVSSADQEETEQAQQSTLTYENDSVKVTADVEAEAVSGNEDEVPIASEELTDGMDISDEPEQDAAETPAAENPEVTPGEEPSEEPAVEPTEAPAENPDVVEEPAEDIASPEEIPAADENGETSLIEVLGDDTNLRVSPSVEAEVLATVNAGTQLTLLDTVTAEDGATWYKVSWEGTEAYIRSDMAQVVDSSDEAEEVEDVQEEEIQPEITRYDYTSNEVNVKVTLTNPADLPDDAKLSVTPVELSQEAEDQITEEAIKEKKAIEKIHSYDIKFLVDGEEVQPGASVKVSVSLNDEKKIKDADVYHVDENDNVENMDGSVAKNGDVEFETTHFSTYVIVQKGNDTINVTVKYCNEDGGKEIYAEDVKSLKIGEKLKLKELANWKVTKVVVDTKSEDHREYPSDNTDVEKSIDLAENATVTAYYEATTGTTIGKPIFFDYTVKVLTKNGGRDSINNPENYSDPKSDKKLTVGGYDASNGNGSAIDNYDDYTYKWWDNGQCPNSWSGKWAINKDGRVTVKGLLNSVNGPNVTFNYADPGFFKQQDLPVKDKDDKTVYLRKVYKDYVLNFDRTGDTYKLSTVHDGKGNWVANAGGDFFPLDPVGYQSGANYNTNVEDWNAHNYFFGLRYDIKFTLGDYIGALNYNFTGDDDLWVVLDGDKVVIDLGGIHSEATDKVDLWKYLKNTDKNAEHTLTVLYMERGAGASNCKMEFTLPNATISQVTTDPLGTLELQKVNSNKEQGLNGARFTLYGDPDCKSEIGSVESARVDNVDGKVIFRSLREGTYYLRETQAPDGYVGSTETWTVEVKKNSDNTEALVTLKDSSGKTVEDKKIVNQTRQEIIESSMDYSKTATVNDWDKRTYDINITASSKTTSSSVVTTGGVADVVMALDVSGSMRYTQTAGDTDTSYVSVGKYNNIRNSLKPNKIYYYSYFLNKYPMINVGNKWMYYYTGLMGRYWKEIEDSDDTNIYQWPSRITALKEVVNQFIRNTATSSSESNIGLAPFNTAVTNATETLLNVDKNKDTLIKNVSQLSVTGGTSPHTALNKALELLNNAKNPKYVILFTDGEPTGDGSVWDDNYQDYAEKAAKELKDKGIKVFTVGFALSERGQKFLAGDKDDSTNYPGIASKGCAFNATNAEDLAKIFEKIQHTVTEDTAIQNAIVTDVIDPRFVILDKEGNAITADQLKDGKTVKVNDGTVYLDAKGNQCIKWEGQRIPNKKENEAGNACWSKSIKVKAKDDYIGGNNVPTNVSPDSKISTGYGDAILPQPRVNVKSDLAVNNNETTIFYGDKVPTAEDILKVLFDKAKPQGYVTQLDGKKKLVTYTMGANGQAFNENDFTLTWYEDEACTKPIEVGNMAKVFPEPDSKKYYLKVTYNAGGDTRTVTAINSDTEKYPNKEYGVYTIHIIKGQIQITKKLKEAAKQNGTFTFKIYKNSAEESNLVTTVTATVKTGDTDAKFTMGNDESKAIVGGLARGEYIVKEVSQSGYQLLSAENDSKVTNCKSEKSEDIKFKDIKFTIGTDNDNKNALEAEALKVEGVDYAKYAGPGCVGKVDYTNKETVANVDFVKVDAADNNITINGAMFTLYKADESWTKGEEVEVVTSKNGGTFGFEKLLPGNYLLNETKAATGYSLVTEPWKIVIKNNGEVTVTKNDGEPVIAKNSDKRYMIENAKVYSLPESGGPGTYGFTISGVAILATALLLFINNKRREEEAKRS